jgi:serine-type D-Ala-D-Ala carboxypeptidase
MDRRSAATLRLKSSILPPLIDMENDSIRQLLESRIEAGDFPSAVYLAAEKGEIELHGAVGSAVVEPERIEAQKETIYDLASLTKPLVAGLLCVKLIERKELDLGRTINFYLPEFDTAEAHQNSAWDTSISELLTHTTLFPAWKPFYLFARERAEILSEIVATPQNFDQPDVTYSDLNFLTLTFLLEKIYGERLDKIAEKEISRRSICKIPAITRPMPYAPGSPQAKREMSTKGKCASI